MNEILIAETSLRAVPPVACHCSPYQPQTLGGVNFATADFVMHSLPQTALFFPLPLLDKRSVGWNASFARWRKINNSAAAVMV